MSPPYNHRDTFAKNRRQTIFGQDSSAEISLPSFDVWGVPVEFGPPRRRTLRRSVWWFVGRLASVGRMWIAAEPWFHLHQGPADGHPERLRRDIPLTATERALLRELPRELRRSQDPFA
ncbi:DUF6059 family protein [Streptomyces sp. NPDC001393]